MAKVNDDVSKEIAFPLKLHAERVASDTAVTDMNNNFKELCELLDREMKDVEKADATTASSLREIVEVFKDNFTLFQNHILQREVTTSKNFEDYSKLSHDDDIVSGKGILLIPSQRSFSMSNLALSWHSSWPTCTTAFQCGATTSSSSKSTSRRV